MIELCIDSCGPGTSLQDFGRFGYRRFGVSPAGAMDRYHLALANALVGNASGTAGIEFCLAGGTLHVTGGEALISLAGPACRMLVNDRALPSSTSAVVGVNDHVTVKLAPSAVYAYLAVADGFLAEPTMGSLSLHRRSGLGGRPLGAGTRIPVAAVERGREPRSLDGRSRAPTGPMRVLLGPQDDYFERRALDAFLGEAFRVAPGSDRMACRLTGPLLEHRKGFDIVSDGLVAGHIQVPGNGQPLVLLRDCPTTGGYPKIATLISADLDRFAQLPAGEAVGFRAVSLEEAVAAASEARNAMRDLPRRLRSAASLLSSERLLGENLVDGVRSAFDLEA